MSEETKTELKLPKAYVRPSLAEFTGPGHGYPASQYDSYFESFERRLADAYAAGEVTDENFVDIRDPAYVDDMTDADGDGLPDTLHVKSQVRSRGNRTLRARQPTRHRFKQYLFSDPSKRLVRNRPLRVPASDVRKNLDELISKEAAGILSVHAPNGQRIDLVALKAGRVSMAPMLPPAPIPNPPLDSAARDVPAGENMPQYIGGTFAGDPIAQQVAKDLSQQKAEEAEKKEPVADGKDPLDPADPVVSTPPSTELEQPPMGVDGNTAPIQDQLPKDSEASVETPADPLAATSSVAAEEQDKSVMESVEEAAPPAEEEASSNETKSSGKSGKKGGKR